MKPRFSDKRARARTRDYLLSAIFGVCLWEVVARLFTLPFLVPFSAALATSVRLLTRPDVQHHLMASVISLLTGFLLAAALGIFVGALMGRYRTVEHLLDLYLDAFLASPALIYVPVLFAFFGVGRGTQVAVVFLYSFFIIVSYTMAGMRSVDRSLIEMARSFGANERQSFIRIVLPGAFPAILNGLRIGAGKAVKGMINGEMFIAFVGLGALLRTAGDRFEPAEVWGLLLIVMAVAVVFIAVLQSAFHRALRALGASNS